MSVNRFYDNEVIKLITSLLHYICHVKGTKVFIKISGEIHSMGEEYLYCH